MNEKLASILAQLKALRAEISAGQIRLARTRVEDMILHMEREIEREELAGGFDQ